MLELPTDFDTREYRTHLIMCEASDYLNQLIAFAKKETEAEIWDIIKTVHIEMEAPGAGFPGVLPPGIKKVPHPAIVCAIYYSVPKKVDLSI